jgi:cobalt transporter subunit CbtA
MSMPAEHEHGADAWEPADGLQRNAFTALFNVIDWVGFALILTGAMVLLRRPIEWREGFLWGLAGFVTFVVAPGLGLPPELPGIPAAALEPRQAWWMGTVVATALGLGLVAFGRTPLAAIGAIVLLALPHLIGAPELETVQTNVPEALSHHFTVAVMLTTLLSWSLLGGLAGFFYRRFAESEASVLAPV